MGVELEVGGSPPHKQTTIASWMGEWLSLISALMNSITDFPSPSPPPPLSPQMSQQMSGMAVSGGQSAAGWPADPPPASGQTLSTQLWKS